MADPVDPIIKLTIPGTGTFPLCIAAANSTCFMTLVNGHPDTTIGANGFGSLAVQNVQDPASFLSVDSIIFDLQTDNLLQPFSAFTNNFTSAFLQRDFACLTPGIDGCAVRDPFRGSLEVKYSGIGKPADAGSFSLGAITCDTEGCPTEIGFVPFSDIPVTVHYVESHLSPDCCVGIQPGVEAGLSITPDVPEPSSFVLLFGAAGLLAVKRRLRRT